MYIRTGIHVEERNTGYLHLPSAVLALFFITTDKNSVVPFPRRRRPFIQSNRHRVSTEVMGSRQ